MIPDPKIFVWYLKHTDEIVINSCIGALFYTLGDLDWDKLELIGEL